MSLVNKSYLGEWEVGSGKFQQKKQHVLRCHDKKGYDIFEWRKSWVALSAESKEEYSVWNTGMWGGANHSESASWLLNIFVFIPKVMENHGSGLRFRRILKILLALFNNSWL